MENQNEIRKFVNNEVLVNQAMLIDELLTSETFSLEDAVNLKEDSEIYEWWVVSDWLTEKLEKKGEIILKNDLGDWWGRQTTGQAIILDGVIEEIWEDINGRN